jgi:hypothetical protein
MSELPSMFGERLVERLGERLGEWLGESLVERLGERFGDRSGEKLSESLGERFGERLGDRLGDILEVLCKKKIAPTPPTQPTPMFPWNVLILYNFDSYGLIWTQLNSCRLF